jgi:hypothetical protein
MFLVFGFQILDFYACLHQQRERWIERQAAMYSGEIRFSSRGNFSTGEMKKNKKVYEFTAHPLQAPARQGWSGRPGVAGGEGIFVSAQLYSIVVFPPSPSLLDLCIKYCSKLKFPIVT